MKPRIQDVLETVMANVGTSLALANVPSFGQIVMGQPVGTALVNIMGQSVEQGLISVFPRPGTARNVTRYPLGSNIPVINLNVPLSVTVTPAGGSWTLTFTGSVVAGLNIHTLCGVPYVDAFYQTLGTESLNDIATAVKTAIVALGFTATASTNNVIVHSVPLLICNIGGTQVTGQLVSRVKQTIQVSIWVPDAHSTVPSIPNPLRLVLADAITQNIGTALQRFLPLSDGSFMDLNYVTEYMDDQAQSDYSLYAYHIAFSAEYDLLSYSSSTQIGAVEATILQGTDAPLTVISGGS